MNRLLIIDDDTELCALLAERLGEDGFVLHAAHDGERGLELASSGEYSLVILDVMLPRMGGMELLKELRSRSSIPVLMLTARGDDIDRIVGLEIGADDYLPKPFNPRELVARIKAILRRLDERRAGPNRFTSGDITIDIAVREAWVDSAPLHLTT
ncbi:response regulator [Edaphobacter aggregans]|uniref:response regulator n=1 Tax=Edaphobacter aggregans TaxID=570835 RepID=UPI00068C6D22|nr:response regulator [Edaphobacter aggregans]